MEQTKLDGELFDVLFKRLFLALRVLGLLRLDLHQDSSFPGRTELGLLIHEVTDLARVAFRSTIHVVPEEFAVGLCTFGYKLLKAEVHRAYNFINDLVFVIELQ